MKLAAAAVTAPMVFIVLVGGATSTDAVGQPGPAASQPYPADLPPAPTPYAGPSTGCALPDPTGTDGCVTGATAWLLGQVDAHFGDLPVSCWDEHAWNPTSDHPRGRACDYTFGTAGRFPGPEDTQRGWLLAEWLQTNAVVLQVAYVIWQGRIWSAGRASEGWRPYDGGGVYDADDPVGGHYDHVHVSLEE